MYKTPQRQIKNEIYFLMRSNHRISCSQSEIARAPRVCAPSDLGHPGKTGFRTLTFSSLLQGSLALGVGIALLRIVLKQDNMSILSGCIFQMYKLSFDCNHVILKATKVTMVTGVDGPQRPLLCSQVRAHIAASRNFSWGSQAKGQMARGGAIPRLVKSLIFYRTSQANLVKLFEYISSGFQKVLLPQMLLQDNQKNTSNLGM